MRLAKFRHRPTARTRMIPGPTQAFVCVGRVTFNKTELWVPHPLRPSLARRAGPESLEPRLRRDLPPIPRRSFFKKASPPPNDSSASFKMPLRLSKVGHWTLPFNLFASSRFLLAMMFCPYTQSRPPSNSAHPALAASYPPARREDRQESASLPTCRNTPAMTCCPLVSVRS